MEPCRTCHATGARNTPLVHDETGERASLCPSCLRASVRMQADARDVDGYHRLADHAHMHGLELWRSPHVAYVLQPPAGSGGYVVSSPPHARMTPVTVPHA